MQSELLQKIEHDAAKGKPCPKDLQPPETMLYYMLMGVYASYQAGRISRKQGHTHKETVYGTYRRLKADYDQYTEVCRSFQQKIREGYSVGGVTIVAKEEKNESRTAK